MALPKSFQLAGVTWTVKVVKGMADMGNTDSMKAEILIHEGMPPQMMEATFYHELVHAIKYTLGESTHDEKEVEQLGGMFHQFTNSRK
jgi:hypothetical protein